MITSPLRIDLYPVACVLVIGTVGYARSWLDTPNAVDRIDVATDGVIASTRVERIRREILMPTTGNLVVREEHMHAVLSGGDILGATVTLVPGCAHASRGCSLAVSFHIVLPDDLTPIIAIAIIAIIVRKIRKKRCICIVRTTEGGTIAWITTDVVPGICPLDFARIIKTAYRCDDVGIRSRKVAIATGEKLAEVASHVHGDGTIGAVALNNEEILLASLRILDGVARVRIFTCHHIECVPANLGRCVIAIRPVTVLEDRAALVHGDVSLDVGAARAYREGLTTLGGVLEEGVVSGTGNTVRATGGVEVQGLVRACELLCVLVHVAVEVVVVVIIVVVDGA